MSLEKKHIFIVDDDESVRRALKFLMMTYGYNVSTFSSSEEFFSAVPNSEVGCLILDIHMPGLNGWNAQAKLKEKGSNRPVIIITGDKNGGLEERAKEAGAIGFLHKPFSDLDLVNLVNKANA